MVASRLTYGSATRKLGRYFHTGSSQRIFPSSTSIAMSEAVVVFVFEPMANNVCASTRSGLPSSLTPNPFAIITESPWTMATATPGIPHASMAFRM
jgi:hypothetical protein